MDKYMIYKSIEFVIFILYLMLIFFSIQLRLIWNDIDKNKLKSSIFARESFLKENIIIVIAAGAFFMVHEMLVGSDFHNSYLYFEFLELIGFSCIVLFMHKWLSVLKFCAHKKPAHEALLDACMSHQAKVMSFPFWSPIRINKLVFSMVFGVISLIVFLAVPFSILYLNLIIGLLFVPPIIVLASMLFCASTMSKKSFGRS